MSNQINPVAFEPFGIAIYWYAIIIVSAMAFAVFLSSREAVKVGLQEDDVFDFMLWGLPCAIIGARLYYVIFEWRTYIQEPLSVFNTRSGGLAVYGGLIAGALVIYFFTKRRFISTWTFLDIAAPSVLIAQGIGRWGNFTNHEAYGPVTTRQFLEQLHLPTFIIDNMNINGFYRQPVFFYEFLWCLLGFVILILLRRKKGFFKEGELFLSYLIWYGLGRSFIEGLRMDSLYLFGVIRASQLLSILLVIGALAVLVYRRKKGQLPFYDRTRGAASKTST